MIESAVVNFVTPGIQKLPFLDLSTIFHQEGVQTFIDWLCVAMYLFPWKTAFAIMGIIIGLHAFRVVVAFFKALWGILPIA